jgi:hypothetical protein
MFANIVEKTKGGTMLGEFKVGEVVYQLAIYDQSENSADGRLTIFVNDENGQAIMPIPINKRDFEQQFRPWGGYKNVFVRAVQIIAIEKDGQRIRFQRLDKDDRPIGDEQLARREEFTKVYLLEHQIVI